MPQEKNIRVTHGRPMTPTSSSGKGAGGLGVSAGGGSSYSGFEHGGFDTGEAQVAITVAGTAEETQKDYQARSQQLLKTIENELAATRLEGSTLPLPTVETINRELAVREKLLARKTAELQRQTTLAHLFFGADPLGKPKSEFYRKAQTMERPIKPKGAAIQSWTASYKAAHEAKLLSQTINVLNQQQAELLKSLAVAQAQEQAENARKAAEAEAKRAIEERARLAAEAQRLAAAEKAAALAKAQALRQVLASGAFPIPGAAAATGPVFTLVGSSLAISSEATLAIQAALRTAITMVVESASAVAAPALAGFAALFYSSELGNGDLYALSVPLSELIPNKSDDLHAIAVAQGEINLPLAIGSRTTGSKTEYVVTTTHSAPTLSKAAVQLATLDSLGNFYRSVSPNAASSKIIWTPIVKPNGASTSLPASMPNMIPYTGATPEAVAGRIDTHPEFDLYRFGGFVTVFPPESGIPPIYTVINSPYEGATTKGEHSGRDFNPEQAGGPILELDWRTATVTQEGLDAVKLHIARLDQSDANVVMIERLERILSGEMNASDVDKRFYTHETRELERFRAQGLADDFIPSDGSAEWNNAHTATLEDYKLSSSESLLYSSEALKAGRKQLEEIYKRLLKGEF